MEISAVAIPTQVLWYHFQAVWLMPIAATITCFILQFAGLGSWLTWAKMVQARCVSACLDPPGPG